MSRIRLFTPGPTAVPEEILLEMARPIFHHRTGQYRDLLKRVTEGMQRVFRTASPVLTFTGSGTSAMEAGIVCCLPPTAKALVVRSGKFGERWAEVCQAYGLEHTNIDIEWGRAVDPAVIAQALKADPAIKAVILTHSETSTGARNDVEAIGRIVAPTDAIFMVDCITSAGAIPLEVDKWSIDIAATGSQKALMLPPGLAFLAVSDKAWKVADSFQPPAYYLDIKRYRKSLAKWDNPYTPAITLVAALAKSLEMIEAEGLENNWARTAKIAHATRQAALAMGLKPFATDPVDSLTSICYPDGIDDKQFRGLLRDKFGVWVAGGQADLSGKIFRISHMGYVDALDAISVIAAVEQALISCGFAVQPGTGLAKAQEILTR